MVCDQMKTFATDDAMSEYGTKREFGPERF